MSSRTPSSGRDVVHFDRRADRYEHDAVFRTFHRPVHLAVVQLVERLRPDCEVVLDVGCGTGALLETLGTKCPTARLVGIDPAPRMASIALARSSTDRRYLVVIATAEQLPCGNASIDTLVCVNAFHHLADQETFITEVARVLRADGVVVIADPFAVGWLGPWARLIGKRRRMRSRAEVAQLFDGAGLALVGFDPVFFIGPTPIVHAAVGRRVVRD